MGGDHSESVSTTGSYNDIMRATRGRLKADKTEQLSTIKPVRSPFMYCIFNCNTWHGTRPHFEHDRINCFVLYFNMAILRLSTEYEPSVLLLCGAQIFHSHNV